MPPKIGRASGMAAASLGAASAFNERRDYELSGDIEFSGEVTAKNVVISGDLSVAGDISGTNLNSVVASATTEGGNVLDTLTVGGTTYTLPSSGSGGGASALDDLTDVSAASASGGQALVYDDTSQQWQPGTVGSTLTVQDEGTNLSAAATILNFKGSGVTASGTGAVKTITISAPSELSEIGNVSTTAPASGQALVYDISTNQWKPDTVALDDLTDVSLTTLADGQALVYDGTSQQWVQGTGLTGWTDSSGHLIPISNAQYDIGSAENKVRHLYLSQNSLYMGSGADEAEGTAISLDASGDLAVGGTKLIKVDPDSGKVPVDKMPVVGVPARTFEVDVAKHYHWRGSYFSIDGIVKRKLVMIRGFSYAFTSTTVDLIDGTHPLKFSLLGDNMYYQTTDQTTQTSGTLTTTTTYKVTLDTNQIPEGVSKIFYKCASHSGMGGEILIRPDASHVERGVDIVPDDFHADLSADQFAVDATTASINGGELADLLDLSAGTFLRLQVNSQTYPAIVTWTPPASPAVGGYALRRVVMWTRNTDSTNDFLMFPRKIRVYGLPVGLADETNNRVFLNSDTDADLVPLYADMVPTSSSDNIYGSTGYGIHRSESVTTLLNLNDSSQYAFEVHFNSAHQVFSKYYFEFYENSSSNTDYRYRPLIGSIRLFGHKTPASTIRVAAGTNVTVSETDGVYTVNSTASGSGGGASTLDDLTDVSAASASQGQALVYNGTLEQWEPGTAGTSVAANNLDLTGNEDNLTSLTVGTTSYKVGTSNNIFINALSYSDSTKMLQSLPFSLSSHSTLASALTNYGSLSGSTTLDTGAEIGFTSGTGVEFDNNDPTGSGGNNDQNHNDADRYVDKLAIVLNTDSTMTAKDITYYCKFYPIEGTSGNARVFTANLVNPHGHTHVPTVQIFDESNANWNVRVGVYDSSNQGYPNGYNEILLSTSTDHLTTHHGRWYHYFIVISSDGTCKLYADDTTSGTLRLADTDSVNAADVPDYVDEIWLGNFPASGTNRDFEGKIASFQVFNHTMSLSDAQDWADYVDRGYINQGLPATLDYLANVSSATPSNGQALVYDQTAGEWQPGTVATSGGASTLDDLTDVSASGASNGQALVYNGSTSQWQPGPVYLEGTVTANVTSNVRVDPGGLGTIEPVNGDSMSFQYIRIGNHVEMIGHIVFNLTSSEQYGYLELAIPNAPSWLRFPNLVTADEVNQTNRPAHCSFQSFILGDDDYNGNIHGALTTTGVTGTTVNMKIAWTMSVASTTNDVGVTMKISWFLPS